MKLQNLDNHARFLTGYHFLLSFLLMAGLIASITNLVMHWNADGFFSATLIVLIFVACLVITWFLRVFPMKAQDRAIRAEESLRYFILAGKAIDRRITMSQVIALRFASDDEFLTLADKAAAEGMAPKDIKTAIVNWRADNYRV